MKRKIMALVAVLVLVFVSLPALTATLEKWSPAKE